MISIANRVSKVVCLKDEFDELPIEQNPMQQYKEAGKYVVVLWVEGPAGKSRRSKVWDVAVK